MIDLGALAKGYIADKLITHCRERNAAFALVNLGGNIVVLVNHQDVRMVLGVLVCEILKVHVKSRLRWLN